MDLLTEPQINDELLAVPAWTREGEVIRTVTERADFRDALLYLGAVAYLAEQASHHPDVSHRMEQGHADPEHPLGRRPDRKRLRPGPPDLGPDLTGPDLTGTELIGH